uniref:PAS domain-containing protein n=1 Tax=uncultured Rhizobium sp. TaxID=155567 RepID=UPI00262E6FD8
MLDGDRFSQLVGLIYDSAADASLWNSALAEVSDAVEGTVATLSIIDPVAKSVAFTGVAGPRDITFPLIGRYAEHMPFFSVLENMTVGEPYLLSDMTRFIGDAGREILEQTVMYREWNKPHGLLDSFCIALIKRPQELVCLNLTLRSDRRPVVDDDRRLVSRLVPHITRAAMIGDQLAIEQRSGGVYRDLLDQMTHSIIIVSRGMRIVYANAAAEQMLSEGVLLRSQRGRLIVTNPAAAERIENDVRLSAYLEHELDGCNFS